jgi:hypothetical protein
VIAQKSDLSSFRLCFHDIVPQFPL